MKQIGINLCGLAEVNGFKYLILCIDYFSKWSEARAIEDKSAPTVANFLYKIFPNMYVSKYKKVTKAKKC